MKDQIKLTEFPENKKFPFCFDKKKKQFQRVLSPLP